VLRLGQLDITVVAAALGRFGVELKLTPTGKDIPGSYWGESEAGLIANTLHARADTPLHSVLHEAAHYICMTAQRRNALHRDAGGDDLEECAVCYLQILLASQLPQCGFERACTDMDVWGYSFRLGSTRAWFEQDAEDARQWLVVNAVWTPATGALALRT
jgi:hypothetical protein